VGKFLIVNSLVTLACACWLALMEIILRHPGFGMRAAVAVCISFICLATILARVLHVDVRRERWLWTGAVALLWIGADAFMNNRLAEHFEGFVLFISLVVVLQGALMLIVLGWPHAAASTRQGS